MKGSGNTAEPPRVKIPAALRESSTFPLSHSRDVECHIQPWNQWQLLTYARAGFGPESYCRAFMAWLLEVLSSHWGAQELQMLSRSQDQTIGVHTDTGGTFMQMSCRRHPISTLGATAAPVFLNYFPGRSALASPS